MGKKFKLPALSDERAIRDTIHYTPYINALTKTILECETPFTIGLHGPWGKGKTSTMRLIAENLEKDVKNNIITVFYDPWEYQFDERPIVPLLHTIRGKILDSQWDKGKISSFLRKFEKVLFMASYVVSEKIGLVKSSSLVTALRDYDDLKEKENTENLSYLTGEETIKRLFESAINELAGCQQDNDEKKIVIFIDDLDRCLPEYALKILEAIKIYLSVKSCVFVLGVEKGMIQNAILYHYRALKEGSFSGKDYLDKLIQLPYNLPDMGENGVETLLEEICEKVKLFSTDEKKECIEIIKIGIDPIPRTVKRFVSSIILQKNIAEALENESKGSFNDFKIAKAIKLGLIYFINENLSLSKKDLFELQKGYKNAKYSPKKVNTGELRKKGEMLQETQTSLNTLKEKYKDITQEQWDRIKKILEYPSLTKSPNNLYFENPKEIGKYLEVLYPEELKNEIVRNIEEIRELKKVLKDGDVHDRRKAAQSLGSMRDASVIPELIEALKDPDAVVRKNIVVALEKMRNRSVIPELVKVFQDPNVEVKSTVVWTLGRLGQRGDDSVIQLLKKALKDSDVGVKRNAVSALGQIEDKLAIPELIETLKTDTDPVIRHMVVLALGQIGAESIISELTEALKDTDAEVRRTIIWILGGIGNGKSVIPVLIERLTDSDVGVKRNVVLALEQIGNKSVIPELRKVLKDCTNSDLKKEIERAVRKLGEQVN
ncbi:MAG: HEAT repeat domain-containing protein [bacterium]